MQFSDGLIKLWRSVNGALFAKPIHLNLVFGFTALDSSENAFSLRNQGKRRFFIFTHIIYQLFMPPSHKE